MIFQGAFRWNFSRLESCRDRREDSNFLLKSRKESASVNPFAELAPHRDGNLMTDDPDRSCCPPPLAPPISIFRANSFPYYFRTSTSRYMNCLISPGCRRCCTTDAWFLRRINCPKYSNVTPRRWMAGCTRDRASRGRVGRVPSIYHPFKWPPRCRTN